MDVESSFLPFKIPELKSRNMRIGRVGLLRRSFSVVPDDFFRIYQNEDLHLEVEFQQEESHVKVFLYTNIDCPKDEWQELKFKQEKNRIFKLSYKVRQCGSYKFKLKYSLDDGKNWYWDRVPFSHVIVDPEGIKDMRMYTMIPSVSGTINDWIEMLPHIAGLGFNAVHLLPITSLDFSESPYSAFDLFSIDKAYREKEDLSGFTAFEKFVEKARELGIRLCFDLTLNHIGIKSRMAQMCPEWIMPDKGEKDGLKRAGCWHMNSWLKWGDLVKIYYDHPHPGIRSDIWDYMTRYSLFWSHFARLTGGMVRLDNLHSSDEGFIAHLLEEMHCTYPDLIVMAEFFTDSNTVLKKAAEWQINLFLANQWEYPYANDVRNYLRYIHYIGRKVRYYLPITTHDTGAPAQLFGKAEAAVPRYAVIALMGTGQTGIVQGVEYGCPKKIDFIGRKQKYEFQENLYISHGIRNINRVLSESSVFHQDGNLEFIDGNHGAVLGALRRPDKESDKENDKGYLIFANLDINNSYSLQVDLSSLVKKETKLKLEDRITGDRNEAQVNDIKIDIEPCGVRIFRIEV
ncbi:MAG TPA: alpha-amylase family glycosyl hydrolase [Syntrophales bacterium]|nr:alpha-amylase family glycosyl hydrolase [Syntrophales bacterium]